MNKKFLPDRRYGRDDTRANDVIANPLRRRVSLLHPRWVSNLDDPLEGMVGTLWTGQLKSFNLVLWTESLICFKKSCDVDIPKFDAFISFSEVLNACYFGIFLEEAYFTPTSPILTLKNIFIFVKKLKVWMLLGS